MDSRLRGNDGKNAVDVIPAKAGVHGFSDQRPSGTRKPNSDSLKGGTTINLFVRNLPRLSVDIDLTYLPVADRARSLADIKAALRLIGDQRHPPNGIALSGIPLDTSDTVDRTYEQ